MAVSTFADGSLGSPLSIANLQHFSGPKGEMYFDEHNPLSQDSKATQERARAFFQHLEGNLSTRDRSKSPLQSLLERISQLPQTEKNQPLFSEITQAFFKQRSCLSRLFSHESWEEWTESRTALGKAASQFRDCRESRTGVISLTKTLDKGVVQQANEEDGSSQALLQSPSHSRENGARGSIAAMERNMSELFQGLMATREDITHLAIDLDLKLHSDRAANGNSEKEELLRDDEDLR